jgi:hypothetical protein
MTHLPAWLDRLFEFFFGCAHHRTTFPITAGASPGQPRAAARRTYVVCLDCGQEFAYDWKQMRIITAPHKTAGDVPSWLDRWLSAPFRGKAV